MGVREQVWGCPNHSFVSVVSVSSPTVQVGFLTEVLPELVKKGRKVSTRENGMYKDREA